MLRRTLICLAALGVTPALAQGDDDTKTKKHTKEEIPSARDKARRLKEQKERERVMREPLQ